MNKQNQGKATCELPGSWVVSLHFLQRTEAMPVQVDKGKNQNESRQICCVLTGLKLPYSRSEAWTVQLTEHLTLRCGRNLLRFHCSHRALRNRPTGSSKQKRG